MLQRELYFFGKLNQSRDFIASDNLQREERNFWDGWFGKCTGQSKLLPFVKKTWDEPSVWLFYIRLYETVYIGLCAQGGDQTGRRYPFVLFSKHLCNDENLLDQMKIFSFQSNIFKRTLDNGKCVLSHYQFDEADGQIDGIVFHESLNDWMLSGVEVGGIWLECGGSRYFEMDGTPTCSLFNKLFG